jgi:hypothetical protein
MSLATVGLFIAAGWVQGAAEPDSSAPVPSRVPAKSDPSGKAVRQRVREGTRLIEQQGAFTTAGDRFQFVAQDQTRFVVLENLALQRIAQVLGEPTAAPVWTVTGLVTEFRGANYLLVTRAVMSPETP